MNNALGDEIRRLRTASQKTLRSFAEELGISAAHLSDIELGRRSPSPQLLQLIAVKLKHVGAILEELKTKDSRIDSELKDWLAKAPGAVQLFRTVQQKGLSPLEAIERLKSMPNTKPKK